MKRLSILTLLSISLCTTSISAQTNGSTSTKQKPQPAAIQKETPANLPVIPDTKESIEKEKIADEKERLEHQNKLLAEEQMAIELESKREIQRKKRKKMAKRNILRHRRTQSTFVAPPEDEKNKEYEVLPTIGLYFDIGNSDYQNITFRDFEETGMANFSNTESDMGFIYGITGNLPFNNYVGMNLLIGGQAMNLKFRENGGTGVRDISLLNLIIQPGFEAGYPAYTDKMNNILVFPHMFASGVTGKTFLDKNASNFDNGQFWGYAYGAAVRLGWGRLHATFGARGSYQIWRLNYDPAEMAMGTSESDYEFMHEWSTFLQPFMSFTIGFY